MALETAKDLIDHYRVVLRDKAKPYLWDDAELLEYMDETVREFARRTSCFPDSKTFTVAVTADDPWVDLDERITEVRSARLVTNLGAVTPVTLEEMDRAEVNPDDYGNTTGDWETSTGVPRYLVTDAEPHQGRLVPIPTTDDTLALKVYREPLEPIDDKGIELTVPLQYRRGLVYGMAMRALLKQDAEAFDLSKSEDMEVKWEAHLQRAYAALRTRHHPAGTVRYGGI